MRYGEHVTLGYVCNVMDSVDRITSNEPDGTVGATWIDAYVDDAGDTIDIYTIDSDIRYNGKRIVDKDTYLAHDESECVGEFAPIICLERGGRDEYTFEIDLSPEGTPAENCYWKVVQDA